MADEKLLADLGVMQCDPPAPAEVDARLAREDGEMREYMVQQLAARLRALTNMPDSDALHEVDLWVHRMADKKDFECGAPACYIPEPGKWVNAYEEDQCYGGPEEGGWWYYRRTPIRSQEAGLQAHLLARKWRATEFSNEGRRPPENTNGEPRYLVLVEDHPGRYAPLDQPRYS